MELIFEIFKFFIYAILIVLVAKYLLVRILRKIGELLNLKPKIIGNIAGIATSIPELLTVSFSALTGLIEASSYNIISSNIINLIQYGSTIILHKNHKELKNNAIKVDLILVLFTILIPSVMLLFNQKNQIILVPIFIILLLVFYRITNNAHKLYMKKVLDDKANVDEGKENKENWLGVFFQVILLLIVGFVLYVVGNLLSDVLGNLCNQFNVPEVVLGILLGFITSIPEFITFFESQKHHEDEKEGVMEATSNLLTSNIMNLFVIQSLAILIYSILY